jgi:hypothetical protein
VNTIGRSGEQWRDLTDDVVQVGVVTVVSRSGTMRILDTARGRQVRRAMLLGHTWPTDGEWTELGRWRLTPCGLVMIGPESWALGTPLWLVAEGEQWGWWCASPFGEAVAAAIKSRSEPFAPGHPANRCPALYCPRAPSLWLSG